MTLADHPQDFASKHDDLGPRIADTNAEMTLLSAVVLQPSIAGEVFAVAPPEAFHDPRHIVIASLLAEMAKAGDLWDPARLVTELMSRGNDVRTLAPYLHTIVSVAAAPQMANYHAKTVRQMWIRREIVGASQKILHRAGDPSWDLSELGAHLATAADRYMDLYTGGQAVKPPPLLVDFIQGEDSWDWVVPGFLERQDRLMITGHEGLGKSHLTRMFGTCAAAGVHPFTGTLVPPVDALIIDCENPERLLRRRSRPIVSAVEVVAGRPRREWAPLRIERIPQGLNLTDPKDAARLDALVGSCEPQVLLIGPLYRLIRADLKEEDAARELVAVLDDIRVRHNVALVIEAHAPKTSQHGGGRTVDPYGTSLFLRWVEFGYGIRRSKDDEETNKSPRIVEVVAWKGAREERYWPTQLMRGNPDNGELPWIPYGTPDELAEVFGNPFTTNLQRRSA